jgi:hypothetical protein
MWKREENLALRYVSPHDHGEHHQIVSDDMVLYSSTLIASLCSHLLISVKSVFLAGILILHR